MSTVVVLLKDILTDPDHPVDLTRLPEADAIEHIKNTYGFLGPLVDVTISNGVAVITLPEGSARKADQALEKLQQASRTAASGRYPQAIRLFNEVLDVLPTHTGARRQLAMAQLESGQAKSAKENLIRVLQVDPKDAWAYLLLANLYFQVENDLGSAERYYTVAVDIAPDDPYILNAYGALLARRKKQDEALSMFDRSSAADPDYPHPRYGKALILTERGDLNAAMASLEELFARPVTDDPRHAGVYSEARRLYRELRRRRASAEYDANLQRLRQTFDEYTARTGIEVRFEQDSAITTDAKVQMAWRYNRPYHLVKYGRNGYNLYLLAHEFEHVLLESDARSVGRNRLFGVGPAQEELAERSLERELRKLRGRQKMDPKALDQYFEMIIEGLANQLFNTPLDLFINRRIYERYPWLRDAIFVGLADEHASNSKPVTDAQIRDMTPPTVYRANLTMNAAYAVFVDDLFGGVTNYAADFESVGVVPAGRHLYKLYLQAGSEPGAEFDLIDAWAKELGLTGWYVWRDDPAGRPETGAANDAAGVAHRSPSVGQAVREGGATNPDYFDDPGAQMAAAMYMVDALKRFAKMEQNAILQIAAEVAVIGMNGIEYGDPDMVYRLRTLPGEEFTGLQMLCLEYVGFKLTRPELDTRIPLDEAYQEALNMYHMGM